jgi:hypothetical protein
MKLSLIIAKLQKENVFWLLIKVLSKIVIGTYQVMRYSLIFELFIIQVFPKKIKRFG